MTENVDPAIRHRNPTLLLALLGYLEDVGEPVPWDEIVELHSTAHRWKTVENALYDLAKFGAVARTGKPGRRGTRDTRRVALTPLGRAWLLGEVLPLPGDDEEPPPADHGLEVAEGIARLVPEAVVDDLAQVVEVHLEHEESDEGD